MKFINKLLNINYLKLKYSKLVLKEIAGPRFELGLSGL